MSNLHYICKCLGGSHLYGLNGPDSDIDQRGIFLNTSIGDIIGLTRHDHQQKQTDEIDSAYIEFRHALRQLQQSNTQIIELLFNNEWQIITPLWLKVQNNKSNLIDSARLFKCLMGYMQSEKRLAFGERKGVIGGKRYEKVTRYGFSPKNIVQLLRLAWAGQIYFRLGFFPVNLEKTDHVIHSLLCSIKFFPERYSKERLTTMIDTYERELKLSFDNRKIDTKFDIELANNLCLEAYKEFLA